MIRHSGEKMRSDGAPALSYVSCSVENYAVSDVLRNKKEMK